MISFGFAFLSLYSSNTDMMICVMHAVLAKRQTLLFCLATFVVFVVDVFFLTLVLTLLSLTTTKAAVETTTKKRRCRTNWLLTPPQYALLMTGHALIYLQERLPKMTENSCVCFSFIDFQQWLVVWPVKVGCIAMLSSSHRFTLISPGVHCVATNWQTEKWGRKVTSLVELGKQERRRLWLCEPFFGWLTWEGTLGASPAHRRSALDWSSRSGHVCTGARSVPVKKKSPLIHYIWQRRWCGTFCPHTHCAR